jgi:hypothetical protein
MEGTMAGIEEPLTDLLDREMRYLEEAIALVAGGRVDRVIVAGLRFGRALVEPLQDEASIAGIRLVTLTTAGGTGADIAVERGAAA